MKQVLTNVYDNYKITDANVCVCVCVRGLLEIRGEDYTSYSAVLLHALQKSRSKAECLCSKERSSVIWHKFDYLINSIRGVVLVVIAGVLVLSGKRSVETSRADTLEKIKFTVFSF